MRLLLLPFLSAIVLGNANAQQGQSDANSTPRLEIRVNPPVWKHGCLRLRIDRINSSKTPVFLPFNGLFIESSATESATADNKEQKEKWVMAFGASSIIILGVKRLAPGHSEHDQYCLAPAIAVVNPEKETRREIPLRGRLKVIAKYYPSEEDWKNSTAQREGMMRIPASEWKNVDERGPLSTSVELEVPCRRTGCPPGCRIPPIILPGEHVRIPDFSRYNPQYIERGNAINRELARTQPPCPD